MAQVFVSYAHVDSDFVALLKMELERAGFDAWVDNERLRAGEDWRQGIDEAIREAFALVAVMSPEAFESKYVTYEWAFALGNGIRVIPIMLRQTKLHPRLEALQYLDFTNRVNRPYGYLVQRLKEVSDRRSSGIFIPPDVPPAIRLAAQDIDSPIPYQRGLALGNLAHANHPAAREILMQALNHIYSEVREIAASLLAEFYDDVRSKPVLLTMLVNGDSFQAIKAAEMIWKFPDDNVVQALVERLSDQNIDEKENSRVCDVAAEALTRIGTPEALAAVEQWQREQDGQG